jgi:tetratricopeptide (TPR) repeat protein
MIRLIPNRFLTLGFFAALFIGITVPLQAQDEDAGTPPYDMEPFQAYSLFYENFRIKDYQMAEMYGEWMLVSQPRELEGNPRFELDTQYRRMIQVYAGRAEQESDPTVRAEYYDKAVALFDDAYALFSAEGVDLFEWKVFEGQFFQQNYANIRNALDRTYGAYQEAFDLDYQRLTEISDGYYVRILLENYANTNQKDEALAMIDLVEPIASPALQEVIDATRNDLFDSPEERIEFLAGQLEKSPGDIAIMAELAELYEETGERARAIELYTQLYDQDPSYDNTFRLAQVKKGDADYSASNSLYLEAFDLTEDVDQKKEIALEVSSNFQSVDNLQQARRYARQAQQLDGQWSKPAEQIGRIYAAAVSQCTQGRTIEREDKTVYWLVLDYFEKAKRLTSSNSSSLDRLIEQYTAVMPTTEDKFFNSWTTGESFTIDASINACYGWINESTTIR